MQTQVCVEVCVSINKVNEVLRFLLQQHRQNNSNSSCCWKTIFNNYFVLFFLFWIWPQDKYFYSETWCFTILYLDYWKFNGWDVTCPIIPGISHILKKRKEKKDIRSSNPALTASQWLSSSPSLDKNCNCNYKQSRTTWRCHFNKPLIKNLQLCSKNTDKKITKAAVIGPCEKKKQIRKITNKIVWFSSFIGSKRRSCSPWGPKQKSTKQSQHKQQTTKSQ